MLAICFGSQNRRHERRLTFTHHSDATLKGFDEPVALFEVVG